MIGPADTETMADRPDDGKERVSMVQRPPMDPRITTLSGVTNFGYPPGTIGRNGQRVQGICLHRMQGTMTGTLSHFRNPASEASSTYGVGKDGTIVQYVHPDNAAWGNGDIQRPDPKLPWLAVAQAGGISANLVTESIEAEGYEGEPWPEPQYQAILALVRWRLAVRGLPANRQTVVGHYQLNSVTRAGCPGTNFPWARLMADLNPSVPMDPGLPGLLMPDGSVRVGEVDFGGKAVTVEEVVVQVRNAEGRRYFRRWAGHALTPWVEV